MKKPGAGELKDFFGYAVYRNMSAIEFENWMVHEFLTSLLVSFLRIDEKGFLDIRRDQPISFKLYESRLEELKAMAENLLFMIGIFPESLSNIRNRRAVGLDYYIEMEARAIARMAPSSFVWREIGLNFGDTILVLNGVRSQMGNFVAPKFTVLADTVRALKNPNFLL